MNQKYYLSILGILFLIFAVSFSYYTFHKPIPTKEIKDSPFSVLLQNATDTYAESTDWYDAKIDYPTDNQKVRDQMISMWNDFAKENQLKTYTNLTDAKKGLYLNVDGEKYEYYATYELATSSNTISYVYSIYTFTGGAHGGTQIFPITLDQNLNPIPVENILPDSSLQKVSVLAKEDIINQKKQRDSTYSLKDDIFIDEGTKPTRDNYSSVWYDGDNIVISFGQYQVGPYVDGIYEVKIPKNSI